MSTKSNLLISPTGSILFMAIAKPVTQSKSDDKLVYTIKLAFDVKKDKDFLAQISEINEAKVVTAETYKGKKTSKSYQAITDLLATGKAIVSANSNFAPEIRNSKNEILEDAPLFFGEATGTAQMVVAPYKGDKGGTINLVAVIIHSIENPEGTIGTTSNRETRKAELEALLRSNL